MQGNSAQFDPDKVAYFEAAGWKAYYAHQWGRAFGLMVQLNREQFRMPLLTALAAAVDIVRASIAFAPLENNDVPKAKENILRYYAKARRTVGIEADAQTLADLEMDYWIVHRNLALERKKDHTLNNAGPMVDSLDRLHAALFQAPAAAIRRSAEERALAAVAVDRITSGYSKDVAADWREVEEHLRLAYGALA
jgi:hypothetical protein